MLLNEIRLIARERGIKTRNRKKEDLIRAILEGEANGGHTRPDALTCPWEFKEELLNP